MYRKFGTGASLPPVSCIYQALLNCRTVVLTSPLFYRIYISTWWGPICHTVPHWPASVLSILPQFCGWHLHGCPYCSGTLTPDMWISQLRMIAYHTNKRDSVEAKTAQKNRVEYKVPSMLTVITTVLSVWLFTVPVNSIAWRLQPTEILDRVKSIVISFLSGVHEWH